MFVTQSNNFHKENLQVFYFLIEKGSNFVHLIGITGSATYNGDFVLSASYHFSTFNLTIRQYAILYTKENLSKREVVVSRRDLGVKSLSETKTSPVVIKDSKEKQTGEVRNGKFMR